MALKQIIYVSTSEIPEEVADRAVGQICDKARERNKLMGVTGVLFFENGNFFQLIEGEAASIDQVYAIIENDPQHRDIVKLVDEPIEERSFAQWNMDRLLIDTHVPLNENLVGSLITIYRECFTGNSRHLMNFIQTMIDETDTFAIVSKLDIARKSGPSSFSRH